MFIQFEENFEFKDHHEKSISSTTNRIYFAIIKSESKLEVL